MLTTGMSPPAEALWRERVSVTSRVYGRSQRIRDREQAQTPRKHTSSISHDCAGGSGREAVRALRPPVLVWMLLISHAGAGAAVGPQRWEVRGSSLRTREQCMEVRCCRCRAQCGAGRGHRVLTATPTVPIICGSPRALRRTILLTMNKGVSLTFMMVLSSQLVLLKHHQNVGHFHCDKTQIKV